MDLKFRRPDGSFVATINGLPYHVIESDPLFEEATAAADELGEELPFEPVPEAPPPTLDDFRGAIQATVDAKAQERRYDSGNSLASYVNSTIGAWAQEATAFVAWRDQVWAYAYAALAEVEAGVRPLPSVDEIISELPSLTWPE